MAITKEDILEAVGNMTVMDLNDLVKAFEEKFGVSAAAMAVAGPAAGAQSRSCRYRAGPQGSQGSRRRRTETRQGRDCQGRRRGAQETTRGRGCQGRSQVIRL